MYFNVQCVLACARQALASSASNSPKRTLWLRRLSCKAMRRSTRVCAHRMVQPRQRMESIGAQQYHTRQHSVYYRPICAVQTYSGTSACRYSARIGTARSTSRPPRPVRALRSCARSARRSSRTTQKRISSTCFRTTPSTLCASGAAAVPRTLTTQCNAVSQQRCGTPSAAVNGFCYTAERHDRCCTL